jgi:hypothetical protein
VLLSLSQELIVTGESFLAMMRTALARVLAGTVFQLYGAPPHFSLHVHAILDGEFPD